MKSFLILTTFHLMVYTKGSLATENNFIGKWTNGFEIYYGKEFDEGIVVYEGGNLHEGGAVFTIKINSGNEASIIGGRPETDLDPSFGENGWTLTYKKIEGNEILVLRDFLSQIKGLLKKIGNKESLWNIVLKTKINHHLAGEYTDKVNGDKLSFMPNETRTIGFIEATYTFGQEFDYPIDVIVFETGSQYFYQKEYGSLHFYEASQDANDYWNKGKSVREFIQTKWFNLTGNTTLHGKYSFASKDLLLELVLNYYSKSELKIMRNEIFARHGYNFKTEEMKNYFSGQAWYRPLYDNVNDKLTDIEKLNIKLIQRFEKK